MDHIAPHGGGYCNLMHKGKDAAGFTHGMAKGIHRR